MPGVVFRPAHEIVARILVGQTPPAQLILNHNEWKHAKENQLSY